MFDLAIKSGKLDVAETLCKLEAEALHNGEHAFHIAATKDSVDLINYLAKKVDVNIRNDVGACNYDTPPSFSC